MCIVEEALVDKEAVVGKEAAEELEQSTATSNRMRDNNR
jgi:hypothetical protein